MTLQDSTFHLPRGEAGDSNLFTAKSFRMVGATGLEPVFSSLFNRNRYPILTPIIGAGNET